MACAFLSGVSQMSLSTPAVFLPWFSVTRRTARALPLNEWVSRRCKAYTLFHLPSCFAFTIRAWRRLTVFSAWGHLIRLQSSAPWEAAPEPVREDPPGRLDDWDSIICFSSFA